MEIRLFLDLDLIKVIMIVIWGEIVMRILNLVKSLYTFEGNKYLKVRFWKIYYYWLFLNKKKNFNLKNIFWLIKKWIEIKIWRMGTFYYEKFIKYIEIDLICI